MTAYSKEDLIRLDTYFWGFVRVSLSLTRKIAFLFTKCETHTIKEVPKILLIKLFSENGYGHLYPLLKKIKKEWPFADVHILTFDLETNTGLENIETIFSERIHKIKTSGLIEYFRDITRTVIDYAKEDFDIYFDLDSKSNTSAVIADLIGAKKSCGFVFNDDSALSRKVFLTHKILFNNMIHPALLYSSMAEAAKSDISALNPEYANKFPADDIKQLHQPIREFTEEEQEEIYETLNFEYPYIHEKTQFVAIAPFDNDNNILKQWPMEHYKELINKFIKNKNIVTLIIGADKDKETAQTFSDSFETQRVINLIGKINLKKSYLLFSLCDLFIANNGQIATLACESKIKTMVLCGPDKPNVCGLFTMSADTCCAPCLNPKAFNTTKCRENDCMIGLDPETVFEAADFLLKRNMVNIPIELEKA
ncbi:MAG: glycosyltransferase family 9 protein [Candidatus Riflebacteria bacterium]|nr:glycosyltransferase family 9 protein [Candidatus Riflebacteria bacterium]